MSQRPAYRGRSLVIGRIQLLSVYWYRTITKHCANNASNDVNRPPLPTGGDDKNKGKKDKSKVIRRPTPTAPHRPPINTSSNHLELVAGRGNLQQRSLSPANSSRPHPALASLPNRSKPGHASPSTAASWRSPSSAPTPDLSPHAKTKALGGHKSKTGSGANPEIMKRSLR